MLLSTFLYATGLLATFFGNTLAAFDSIVMIDSPQITVLDFLILMVVIMRVYVFINFLQGREGYVYED